MKKLNLLILSTLFLVLLLPGAIAYTQQDAELAIYEAEECIMDLNNSNLSTQRTRDMYLQAENFHEAQVLREEQNLSADYNFVVSTSAQICELKDTAFQVYDELKALEFEVESARDSGIPMDEIDELYSQAVSAFESERYEEANELIPETYAKISEVEATTTKLVAFYEASTKTLRGFLERNWKAIIVVIIISSLVGFVLKHKISIILTENHIEYLELEKETIYDLIKNIQRVYFDEQNMSESEYLTKTKKYKEILRDINRQIPVLKTELQKKKEVLLELKKMLLLHLITGKEEKPSKIKKEGLSSMAERLGGVKVKEDEAKSKKHEKKESEKKKSSFKLWLDGRKLKKEIQKAVKEKKKSEKKTDKKSKKKSKKKSDKKSKKSKKK